MTPYTISYLQTKFAIGLAHWSRLSIAQLTLLILAALLPAVPGKAQEQVSIPSTQVFNMPSTEVGDTYKILVGLPFGYEGSEQEYQTIYVLDADVSFAMVWSTQTLLSFEKQNPPSIIIGIAYQDLNQWSMKRSRDYVANSESAIPGAGGGALFLKFLSNELIPTVEKRFRTNGKRILYGHSTAGLFCLYSLLSDVPLFSDYIITSPSINEDADFSNQLLQNREPKAELKSNVYLAIGTKEPKADKEVYKQFLQDLKARDFQKIKLHSEEIDATHMSMIAPSFVRGIEFITKQD